MQHRFFASKLATGQATTPLLFLDWAKMQAANSLFKWRSTLHAGNGT